MKRRIFILLWLIGSIIPTYAVTPSALADSLNRFVRARITPMTKVSVYSVRVSGHNVRVETNPILSGLDLSQEEITNLKQQVSLWTTGTRDAKVQLISNKKDISEFITFRHKSRPRNQRFIRHVSETPDLQGHHIAISASHGIYYDYKTNYWHWQRARMWGIVEDIYTSKYAWAAAQMIENAGGKVYMPRPRIGVDSAALEIGPSGYPRWMEAARYWLAYQGYPESLWNTTDNNNHYIDDIRCRGNWVNYLVEHDSIPIELLLAIHTDGISLPGDSDIMGTLAIYTDINSHGATTLSHGKSRVQNRDLCDYIQTAIVEDLQKTVAPDWKRRELWLGNYGESRMPEMPSMILELLSHKNMADMRYGLNPEFQFVASRAIYKGILRYLHAMDGTECIIQPLPIRKMRIENADFDGNRRFRLVWETPIDSLEPSAHPDEYIVYIRQNGGDWSEGIRIQKNHYTFTPKAGIRYDMKVVATNEGGKSLDSPILSAFWNGQKNDKMVSIIDGMEHTHGPKWFADSTYAGIIPGTFALAEGIDYSYMGQQMIFDKHKDWVTDDDCGLGMSESNYVGMALVGNTHDYSVWHGQVLQKMNISYISSTMSFIDTLADNMIADIILGDESTSSCPQWLTKANHMLISSSNVGRNACVRAHKACTSGKIRMTNAEGRSWLSFHVTPNEERIFASDVSGLQPYQNGQIIARYNDTQMGACEVWKTPKKRIVLWGVPLESMTEFEYIYKDCINYLLHEKEELTYTGTY